jgi:hypothetical protein
LKYQGYWYCNNLKGKGSIIYSDNIKHTCMWKDGNPDKDVTHPIVKECIDKGLCTNTLPVPMPQNMYWSLYCQHCLIHCKKILPERSSWTTVPKRCFCLCTKIHK